MPGVGRKIVRGIEKGLTKGVLAGKSFWREVTEALDEAPKAIDRFASAVEEVVEHADQGTAEVCKGCGGEGYDLDGLGVQPCPDCQGASRGGSVPKVQHYWGLSNSGDWHCFPAGSATTICDVVSTPKETSLQRPEAPGVCNLCAYKANRDFIP